MGTAPPPVAAAQPLFPDVDLAARLEAAECRLLVDGTEEARSRGSERALARALAGGVATWSDTASPLNKLAGLGFGGIPEAADLAAVEEAFDARETPLQVELSSLGDPAIAALLSARGYILEGFEHVLGRRLPIALPPADDAIAIEPSPISSLEAWVDTVLAGFAVPDGQGVPAHESFAPASLRRVIGDMARSPRVCRYLARLDGVVAGGGSLRIDQGIAQLCGAATLPEHRRRGVQAALLRRRLEAAGNEGCDLAVVTVQPGSKSQQNVQRLGFQLLYCRAVLVREKRPRGG